LRSVTPAPLAKNPAYSLLSEYNADTKTTKKPHDLVILYEDKNLLLVYPQYSKDNTSTQP